MRQDASKLRFNTAIILKNEQLTETINYYTKHSNLGDKYAGYSVNNHSKIRLYEEFFPSINSF
jgi:hypothetical protein